MPEIPDSDLQRLQQQLIEREAELREELKTVRAEKDQLVKRMTHEEVEDMGEQGEERIRSALRHAEEERDIEELRDIDDARERMREGRYGECEDCGREIGLQRLFAQPTARRCIACQQLYERAHPASPRFPASL